MGVPVTSLVTQSTVDAGELTASAPRFANARTAKIISCHILNTLLSRVLFVLQGKNIR